MKKTLLCAALILALAMLTVCSATLMTACDAGDGTETGTEAAATDETAGETLPETAPADEKTDAPTDPVTDAPTDPETVADETVADETAADETVPEETEPEEETEAPDPTLTPVVVGMSANGKYPCYDGQLEHEWEEFKTKYGVYYSIQAAVDDLYGEGGNVSLTTSGETGLCLSVNIPDDGCFYRINYNWNYCDFVFNFGYTYDDDNIPNGYAYYSDLTVLDNYKTLDGHHVYCWVDSEWLLQGYYEMHYVGDGGGDGGLNYHYEYIGSLEEYWPGLYDGESYFD